MSTDADRLRELDTDAHKDRAAGFWAVSTALTSAMVIAFPPTRALGATAGWAIAGAWTLAVVLYIGRLFRAQGQISTGEVAASASMAVVGLAVMQWLAGGYRSPIEVVLALHVFGGAAILAGRVRAVHLGLVVAAVLAPLAYTTVSASTVVAAVVYALVLLIMGGFLLEYGRRFRAQRFALYEAERQASARAVTDPLTGLGNRRALEAELGGVAERVARGESVTVVYLDLDGFKAYNDRLGHEAGDALLQRLAGTLVGCLDGNGLGFRIGGDEFCAVLEGTVASSDPHIAAIRGALTDESPGVGIAPSYGVVNVPDDAPDGVAALSLADARMYEHKRGGRPGVEHDVSRAIVQTLSEHDPTAVDLAEVGRSLALRLGLEPSRADAVARALEPRVSAPGCSAPDEPPARPAAAPRAAG